MVVDDLALEDDEIVQLSIEPLDSTAIVLANPIVNVTIIDMDGKFASCFKILASLL